MPPLVYLDTCCLNRPSDDQRQPRVRLEAEAVLTILAAVEAGRGVAWLGSAVLRTEVERNPDPERRRRALGLLHAATRWIALEPQDVARGAALQRLATFAPFDALHVAVAERGRADVLLTTDDRFVRGRRGTPARSAWRSRTRSPGWGVPSPQARPGALTMCNTRCTMDADTLRWPVHRRRVPHTPAHGRVP